MKSSGSIYWKVTVIILTAMLPAFQFANAQDIIVLRNGEEMKAQVTEVGQIEVKYRKFENLAGPLYTLKKDDVFMIRYENGSKDVFNQTISSKMQDGSSATSVKNNPTGLSARSGGAAFFYSFLYPGTGQLYARKKTKGIIMLGTFTAATVLFLAGGTYDDYSYSSYWNGDRWVQYSIYNGTYWTGTKTAGLVLMTTVKLWSMIDAPFSARSTNKKLGLAKISITPDGYWVKGADGPQSVIGAKLKIKL